MAGGGRRRARHGGDSKQGRLQAPRALRAARARRRSQRLLLVLSGTRALNKLRQTLRLALRFQCRAALHF